MHVSLHHDPNATALGGVQTDLGPSNRERMYDLATAQVDKPQTPAFSIGHEQATGSLGVVVIMVIVVIVSFVIVESIRGIFETSCQAAPQQDDHQH
jgi:hypothetical protein